MEKRQEKRYETKNTGYTGEEKKMIRNYRKCSRKEREILRVLVEKTAMGLTELDDLSDLLK